MQSLGSPVRITSSRLKAADLAREVSSDYEASWSSGVVHVFRSADFIFRKSGASFGGVANLASSQVNRFHLNKKAPYFMGFRKADLAVLKPHLSGGGGRRDLEMRAIGSVVESLGGLVDIVPKWVEDYGVGAAQAAAN